MAREKRPQAREAWRGYIDDVAARTAPICERETLVTAKRRILAILVVCASCILLSRRLYPDCGWRRRHVSPALSPSKGARVFFEELDLLDAQLRSPGHRPELTTRLSTA